MRSNQYGMFYTFNWLLKYKDQQGLFTNGSIVRIHHTKTGAVTSRVDAIGKMHCDNSNHKK